jgi:hypothetical protein
MAELEAKAGGSSLPKAASKMPASVDWAMELEKQKASEMSPLSRFAMSVGQPMADIERTGRRVFSNAGIGNYGAEDARRDKQLESPYINQAGRMTGDVLLNIGLPTPDKGGVLRRTLMNLGQGAAYGAATTPENAEGGAVGGALGSAAGMGVNRLLGGLVKPFISQDAKELAKQGIQPTLGQSIGGVVNTAEQKLRSVPFLGDMIRGARNRSINEFNEKAIQIAEPGAKGFGDEALLGVRKTLGDKYDSILDSVPKINVDQNAVLQSARSIAGNPSYMLKNDDKKVFLDLVRKNVLERTPNINGQMAKTIESDLKTAASNASSNGQRQAIQEFTNAWKNSLKQSVESVNPGAGKALRENDAAWRSFIPVERAGAYRGNQNAATNEVAGRFTPNSLRRSIEVSDQSQFNNVTRALRGGDAPFERLNTLTRQGEKVLGDSVPDSGTAGRLGMMEMFKYGGAGAAGAGAAYADPSGTLGTAALLAFPYSRSGSKFFSQGAEPLYEAAVKQLSLRGVPTQVLDEALRKYGPEGVISLARSAGVSSQQ